MSSTPTLVNGHLDIRIIESADELDGSIENWQEVLIHGDPNGLRSLAQLLIRIANTNQDENTDLPNGAREHFHLNPNRELSKTSNQVIIGRLDAKGTGKFYQSYIQKDADEQLDL